MQSDLNCVPKFEEVHCIYTILGRGWGSWAVRGPMGTNAGNCQATLMMSVLVGYLALI